VEWELVLVDILTFFSAIVGDVRMVVIVRRRSCEGEEIEGGLFVVLFD
jgi:hypothetical protein